MPTLLPLNLIASLILAALGIALLVFVILLFWHARIWIICFGWAVLISFVLTGMLRVAFAGVTVPPQIFGIGLILVYEAIGVILKLRS